MTTPSPTTFASSNPGAFELTTISVQASKKANNVMKESFAVSMDREIARNTRKATKHRLGSKALNQLTGPNLDWSKSSMQEVKQHLMKQSGLDAIAKESKDEEDWTHPVSTKDGSTAVECLKQLRDVGMIGKTRFMESPTNGSPETETMKLIVKRAQDKSTGILKKDLSYEQTRDVQKQTKRNVKQYLACMALNDIAGPEVKWNDLTFPELRDVLMKKSQAARFSPNTSQ